MVNTILKEADLFCPNSVRINFTIYLTSKVTIIPELGIMVTFELNDFWTQVSPYTI
ncbi:Aspartate aminotransferase [Levilactobacillus zymae]|uniref:Aspartate aminotransferase n=1 Tax=Levilactobacillus zymae TaxID=267363 RepID=A0A1Y6JXB8_9LACO|nr:Aspartate aminotransferase [Levilactobacillus zymae]